MADIAYIVRLINKETGQSYFGTIEASEDIVAAASAAVKAFGEECRVVGLYPEEHQHRLWFDSAGASAVLADEQKEEER